jgi:hypothetical protein
MDEREYLARLPRSEWRSTRFGISVTCALCGAEIAEGEQHYVLRGDLKSPLFKRRAHLRCIEREEDGS